jgi:hypothetical protein
MGESFFSPYTRHVSMYLRPGIVILKFIHSVPRGIIFISVLSHWCGYSSWVVSNWVSVRATGTAHGTHAPWVASRRRTCDGYSRWNGCVETPYVRWLQQMEHTHRGCVETCMLGETPSAPWVCCIQCLKFVHVEHLNVFCCCTLKLLIP